MHSIATVKSASGAAKYYTKDDFVSGEYYTDEKAGDVSMWGGAGAAAAGLSGKVSQGDFRKALEGELPSGEKVDQREGRRAGYDLTFSAPKSVSVMAYVAGDKRLLGPDGANTIAVQKTMAWIEKNLAETRITKDGKTETVKTGNLLYALFQHDTSRALDPQAHLHSLVSNLTQGPDGKWHALHADKIWKNNTVIGAIYHAFLRYELEKLGYKLEATGKHGTFEIVGVPKVILETFSKRGNDIKEQAEALGIFSPEGRNKLTVITRDPKLGTDDRDALRPGWVKEAEEKGFDGKALLAEVEAIQRAAAERENAGPVKQAYYTIVEAVKGAQAMLSGMMQKSDPLVDRGFIRQVKSVGEGNAQLAVASAVRILGQREAAFDRFEVSKKALDLNVPGVTIDHVEARIDRLIEKKLLLPGQIETQGRAVDALTTPEAVRTEERILAKVEEGRGAGTPIVAPSDAPDRLQAASPHEMNAGQLAAATLIVSTTDRIVAVQGVAGAGKSTMLQAVARVVESEGKSILGLAFQNKMVADMKEGMARPDADKARELSVDQMQDAGVQAETIAGFIYHNERHALNPGTQAAQEKRDELRNTIIVVDETSMVSNVQMLKMVTIAEALGIEKIALIGDRQQLLPIDAGKAFLVMQAGKIGLARMDENLRQQTTELRTVAALANVGKASAAMKVLGDNVVEEKEPAVAAAERWLNLSGEERAQTAVFASGRKSRTTINLAVQEGLKEEGTLKGEGVDIDVLQAVNVTDEEMRYAQTYKLGQVLEIKGDVKEVGLTRGTAKIIRVIGNRSVEIEQNGRRKVFDPQKIDATKDGRLQLSTLEPVRVHEGETIRWTNSDKSRGIFNSALAKVTGVENGKLTVELASKESLTIEPSDPMMKQLNLAYALNMHMAQGITTMKAIVVMLSHEVNLSNQRLFNVAVTRVREGLSMVVDNIDKLGRQLDSNPGNKTSGLETVGRLDVDGQSVRTQAADDAPTEALGATDKGEGEPIMIDPRTLALDDLPAMGKSNTDYSDEKGIERNGLELEPNERTDRERSETKAHQKEDDLGPPPLIMDDLSSLPAMGVGDGQIRGLPEKHLSLDL